MKGFKWLFILLIGMISSTGFAKHGDLTENSTTIDITVQAVDTIDSAIIDTQEFTYVGQYKGEVDQGYFMVTLWDTSDCMYAVCGDIVIDVGKESETVDNINYLDKQQLTKANNDTSYHWQEVKQLYNTATYKKPRDGINWGA